MTHLDKNGDWVLLVYAIVGAALLIASAASIMRSRSHKRRLDEIESEDV